ncbi:MAG: phage portal protein [Desulfurellales bacterium]|nr:MAG: phage portal protein [Desulfurellales bacterium]
MKKSLRLRIARAIAIALGVQAYYDAGKRWSADRSWIPGEVTDAKFDADGATRWEIVRKARYFEANSGLVNRLADLFEQYTVGESGLRFIPASSSDEWNTAAANWWAGWCPVCDVASLHPFGTLQSLIARAWLIDGEAFVVLTSGRNAPSGMAQRPRIQLVESHRVATPIGMLGDSTVIDGIEIDRQTGRPVAYWIRTGDAYNRVDAASVIHVFEPSRIGQYRGLSFLTPVMNDLHDLDDLQMLEMKAAKVAAEVTNVITTETGELTDEDIRRQKFTLEGEDSLGHTGTEDRERHYRKSFGGRTVALKSGEDIKQFISNRPSVAAREYWDYLTSKICAGVGISKLLVYPYTLQGTVTRSDLDVSATFFRCRSAVLQAAFARIYLWAIDWARANERSLADPPSDWKAVTVRAPRSVNVDVGRNSTAMLEELKNGVRTYEDIYAEQGEDWRQRLRQKAREAALIRDLSVEFGVSESAIAELSADTSEPAAPQLTLQAA